MFLIHYMKKILSRMPQNAFQRHPNPPKKLIPKFSQYIVIMDNASWHKTQRTRELIASSGARLLYRFPPYSPDLNPIEHDFANIKRRWEYNNQQPLEDIIKVYK